MKVTLIKTLRCDAGWAEYTESFGDHAHFDRYRMVASLRGEHRKSSLAA